MKRHWILMAVLSLGCLKVGAHHEAMALGPRSAETIGGQAATAPDFKNLSRIAVPRAQAFVDLRLNGYLTRFLRDPDQTALTRTGHWLIDSAALSREEVARVLERIRARDSSGAFWVIDDKSQQVHLGHFGGVADGGWKPGTANSVTGTDNFAALQAFIHWRGYFQETADGRRKPVLIPRGIWRVDGQIEIGRPNVSISGYGATLAGRGLTWFGNKSSSGLTIAGLKSVNNSGRGARKLWSLYGARTTFLDTEWVYAPADDFQMGFVWPEARDSRFLRYKSSGGSEIVIYAPGTVFDGFDVTGILGDDGFVIKAPGSQAHDIQIVNGTIRDSASILSIGSEVGARRTADPAHGSFVRGVRVVNVIGENVAYGLYIKPGALKNDYRDGLVEDVDFDARIVDPTGAKFRAGARIDAARGAIIRDVDVKLSISARAIDGRARNAGLRINAIDMGKGSGFPTIERIKADLVLEDPYRGVANGPGAPGYPLDSAVIISASPGARVGRTDLWLTVNGARNGALVNGQHVKGPVVVHRLAAENLCRNPASSRYDGVIVAGSPVTIDPAGYRVAVRSGARGCAHKVLRPK